MTALLRGSDLCGESGKLWHSREKSAKVFGKTVVLMSRSSWSPQELQHFAGQWGFAAAFRRPLFSVLEATHSSTADALVASQQVSCLKFVLRSLGSAGLSLRAPVRSVISCSDASGIGGSASEARNVLWYRAHKLENEVDLARTALQEISAQDNTVHECCVSGSSPGVLGLHLSCAPLTVLVVAANQHASFFMCSLALGLNVPKADLGNFCLQVKVECPCYWHAWESPSGALLLQVVTKLSSLSSWLKLLRIVSLPAIVTLSTLGTLLE